ncbi:MAG: DUF4097 domain-containing protein [bacterium]|nr:DUF4097 domain-containing protein [bacterium]
MIKIRSKNNCRIFSVTSLIVLLLVSVSICSAQTDREKFVLEDILKKTYDFNSGGEVMVENSHGNISIETWDQNKVEIEADEYRRGYSELEIEISYTQDRIRIETIEQRDYRWSNDRKSRCHYTIKVPRNTNIFANTTHGRIDVEEVEGKVELETSHGRIEVRDVSGTLDVKTSHASIELEGITGNIYAQTSHSPIYIYKTTSEEIDAETSHSQIRADIVLDENGRYDFVTSHGSIELTVPGDSKMDVDVYSSPKDFRTDFDMDDFDIPQRRSSSRRSRYDRDYNDSVSRFDGSVNGGGARVRLKTSHGRISLRSK